MASIDVVEVRAWGRTVGAVVDDRSLGTHAFEYTPDWVRTGAELSPLHMPNRSGIYRFPTLSRDTFKTLPAMLADALPDDFGNAVIRSWLAARGVDPSSLTMLDRLTYVGTRGMGALTFHPPADADTDDSVPLQLNELVLEARAALDTNLAADADVALRSLISVGISAGGARAKAVVAYNPDTGRMRSGQIDAPDGYSHWLVKLDGVTGTVDRGYEIDTGSGWGRVEYAYSLMAAAAGIDMAPCDLIEEGGRAHFITRRFDRTDAGDRLHAQTLCGLDHLDFRLPGAHSYEQALFVIDRLGLGHDARAELFRRAVFNIAAVNRDDHTKNFGFLCTEAGEWSLAPAYDITHSYRASSEWVARHQMSIGGTTENHTVDQLLTVADRFGIGGARSIIADVRAAVADWPTYASAAGVDDDKRRLVATDMAGLTRNLA